MAVSIESLTRAKYSGLDFDTHIDDLRSQLQVKFAAEFNDFALASLGMMLLDVVAFGLDTLSFYLDRRATDLYLETSRSRKAVERISRQLGYKMGGAIASSVDLQVAVKSVYTFNVLIPQKFQFKGPNGLVFEVARDVTFTPAEQGILKPKSIPCYEGETFTESFVSTGLSNQVFFLRRVPTEKFIVKGTVSCVVNGVSFVEYDLLDYGETDQFEVGYNDVPPSLRFGDGVAGNIPISGASIVVSYVASKGMAGQVPDGTITDVVRPLVVSFQNIALAVNNPQPSVGGDDAESISRTKSLAPKVAKTRDVAVTATDFTALGKAFASPLFGRVATARAISSRSASTDLYLETVLASIRAIFDSLISGVSLDITSITSELDSIDANLSLIASDLASIVGYEVSVDTKLNNSLTDLRGIKNKAAEIGIDVVNIADHVVSGKIAIDAIGTGTVSTLTVSDKAALKEFFDLIDAQGSSIVSLSSTIQSDTDTTIGNIVSAREDLETVGLDLVATGTVLYETKTHKDFIGSASSSLRTLVLDISSQITGVDTNIPVYLDQIYDHVDAFLSHDCKANLISVPILTKDAAGFYAAPSFGLIDALQTYLDGKKGETQTVVVVSGEDFLIPAVLTLRVGVKSRYSQAVVKTAVEAAVDAVLRGRDYGQHLYISDVNEAVKKIEGVSFVNIVIDGYLEGSSIVTTKLDDSGNLIVGDQEVLTKGSVIVNTEAVNSI
jgi:hypothetical protein